MTDTPKGYPFEKAMGIAVSASEELKTFFQEIGVQDVHFIAGASYWAGESHSHPNLSIHLPAGDDFEATKAKASALVAEIEKRGIRITIFSHDASFRR